jgi:carboxypeptidase Q
MIFRSKIVSAVLIYTFLFSTVAFGQTVGGNTATRTAPSVYTAPKETIDKIREEGLGKNSQVMQTLSYLSDVIGGRLTGSANMKRANEWTRDTMAKWGMQNAKLEAWGPFGRGWALKNFSAQIVEPQTIPVIAFPKAWSPSTKGAVTGEVVHFEVKDENDFAKYKGKLAGKIVLISNPRELKANFTGFGKRLSDEELAKMANAPNPADAPKQEIPAEALQNFLKGITLQSKSLNFLLQENAAVVVDNSFGGSGGTLFVQEASVAPENIPTEVIGFFSEKYPHPWRKVAESRMLPQMTMATEDYNRLVRMIKLGLKPQMTVNINAQYEDADPMAYNTVAEVPGTDPKLKDEIVMLGAHLDSWHSSGGATDNAAGSAVVMEAARIILASGLKPRRTIRVALWSGEEQALYGSREYVKKHFGEFKEHEDAYMADLIGINKNPRGQFVKGKDYDKLSAYYNLDNGTGKIRGVYLQGNSAVAPIFRAWLEPFKDLGATTITLSNTSGTDHLSFDRIGLPGFQFIQDPVEYDSRTHHSNQDNYDRIQADNMKQAATIMAAFVYQTAMIDDKLPRKRM